MDENQQPVFKIEKLYVKDLSLEVPSAPAVFMEQATPTINVELGTQAGAVGEGFFEVSLKVTVTAKIEEGDKTMFLVEVTQCGVFQLRNVPQEDIEAILMVGCANILFPYAREAVSDASLRAGFQPVLLAPVNFEALFAARQEEAAKQQGNIETPVQ